MFHELATGRLHHATFFSTSTFLYAPRTLLLSEFKNRRVMGL